MLLLDDIELMCRYGECREINNIMEGYSVRMSDGKVPKGALFHAVRPEEHVET
jgi:hypothetical protein